MAEHYSGRDPETGCALTIIAVVVVVVVVVVTKLAGVW